MSGVQRSNSFEIGELEDIEPPVGNFLSGKYKRSFAYLTIKDRLPVILTKIVDSLSRNKDSISQKYSEQANEDIKKVIGAISKIKNELVTNKPILPLTALQNSDKNDDTLKWNQKLEKLKGDRNEIQTWYNTVWLFCECYMYRRIAQDFLLTKYLNSYDPFEPLKQESFLNAKNSMSNLCQHFLELINSKNKLSLIDQKNNVINLIKLSLWGNRSDLSLSAGVVSSEKFETFTVIKSLDKNILTDDTEIVWDILNKHSECQNGTSIIDIVLDNAGYELFTDLLLAVYIVHNQYASKVRFYVKKYPWFISDVTKEDFYWVIHQLIKSDENNIKKFGLMCEEFLKTGAIIIEEESFWTEPYDYSEMKNEEPNLYKKLSEAFLVIFKGDLNYRKLLGDINWELSTSFSVSLRGFQPSNILALRTLKADLCAGLSAQKIEAAKKEDLNWMVSGNFGIIQTSIKC